MSARVRRRRSRLEGGAGAAGGGGRLRHETTLFVTQPVSTSVLPLGGRQEADERRRPAREGWDRDRFYKHSALQMHPYSNVHYTSWVWRGPTTESVNMALGLTPELARAAILELRSIMQNEPGRCEPIEAPGCSDRASPEQTLHALWNNRWCSCLWNVVSCSPTMEKPGQKLLRGGGYAAKGNQPKQAVAVAGALAAGLVGLKVIGALCSRVGGREVSAAGVQCQRCPPVA